MMKSLVLPISTYLVIIIISGNTAAFTATEAWLSCGTQKTFYTETGKFGTQYSSSKDLVVSGEGDDDSGNDEEDPLLHCKYSVRAQKPTVLYWLHLSSRFDGVEGNCSEKNNIISVNIGCVDPQQLCITNKTSQHSIPLFSTDGCFDIKVTINTKGNGFFALFEESLFVNKAKDKESDTSLFSKHLAYIIVGPIMFFLIMVGLMCVLMRQKQQKRMLDSLQSEQTLIYRGDSNTSQVENDNSPTEKYPDENQRLTRLFSNHEAKRLSRVSRYLQRPPSEYRISHARYSLSFSGESKRPLSEMRKSYARHSLNSPGNWQPNPLTPGVEIQDLFASSTKRQTQLFADDQPCSSKDTKYQFLARNKSHSDPPNYADLIGDAVTHFIENPLEQETDPDFIVPYLVPLRDHENSKRFSQANRLSSLDSFFDENILSHEDDEMDTMEDSRLIRQDSSDSYFDQM